jgi:hypothetical protein
MTSSGRDDCRMCPAFRHEPELMIRETFSNRMCKALNLGHEAAIGPLSLFVSRLSDVSKNVQEMDLSANCYERKQMP